MNQAALVDIEAQVEALAEAGRMDLALPLLKKLVDLQPKQPRHRLNLAFSLLDSGLPAEALDQIGLLPENLLNESMPRFARGLASFQLESYEQAILDLTAAFLYDPNLHIASILAARALLVTGDYLSATETLRRVPLHDLAVDDAAQLATCLMALHRYPEALELVERTLLQAPAHAELLFKLAQLRERKGLLADAAVAIKKIETPTIASRILEARIVARQGRVAEAISMLEDLRAQTRQAIQKPELALLEFELGKWLDRSGRYEQAWPAFSAANQIDRERNQRIFPDRDRKAIQEIFYSDPRSLDSTLKAANKAAEPSPLFIVGFPRSGTTLLDNLLDAHPQFVVLDEKPLLDPAMLKVTGMPKGYPLALADVDETQLSELRRLYWDQVRKFSKPKPGTRVVDKNPFNLLRVPLIKRLFPNARWLFSIRHPLDVVISCFMQKFDFTELTLGFCDLADIAEVYKRSMTLWLDQKERLQLDCIDIRYEELVRDPEGHSKALFEKLELPWVDSVLNFDQSAKKRWISTPSYDQVTRRIYTESLNRWRNYLPWLTPAVASLNPLIERLGYDTVEITS